MLLTLVCSRYDPVALLCAVPATRHFFSPCIRHVRGVDHLVIGTSKDQPGVHSGSIETLRCVCIVKIGMPSCG